uniref:Mast cell protease 1A-like n=1 Tax=Pelodiscus sinensis TaxID=13735 RepID=K7FGF2_PELSI
MQVHILFLLPMAFLLLPGTWSGEIIGGKEAKPHSRPYMAYLEIQFGEETFRCGGFLVAKNFVLTAAHCQGDTITAVLGAHSLEKRREQQKIKVSKKIPHEKYNNRTKKNDFMLLQLAKPAKLNKFVNTIPLPKTGETVEPGMVCSVAGWGLTIANDISSAANALREVDVEVLEDDECSYGDNYDPATMLCVGHPQKCRDSAKGDSGGPLVCDGKPQGIVSWGTKDGTPPGVYTRVSTFIRWIQDKMRRPQ